MVLKFFTHKKTPKEIVQTCDGHLSQLVQYLSKSEDSVSVKNDDPSKHVSLLSDAIPSKLHEDIVKDVETLRNSLLGNSNSNEGIEQKPKKEDVQEIAKEIFNLNLFLNLVYCIPYFEFETRKMIKEIFKCLIKVQIAGRQVAVDFIAVHPQILTLLLAGYDHKQDVSLLCSELLKDCIKNDSLTKQLLNSKNFFNIFKYLNDINFGVASDAFSLLRESLTKHKNITAEFLSKNYDTFFSEYTKLMTSNQYVTKRLSLKLLGELLLERSNFEVRIKYIKEGDNLKLIMNSLLDKHKNIQFEAFHVFKVFVANPHKSVDVKEILKTNKSALCDFLADFHKDRVDDTQFIEEKQLLIDKIRQL